MQLSMNFPLAVPSDAYEYGERTSGETHGVVLTKPHVVELILDLAGYTADRDLTSLRLLEPACGHGAFLVPAVKRLLEVARRNGCPIPELAPCLSAFDIDARHVALSRQAVRDVLEESGFKASAAAALVHQWIHPRDFLLEESESNFDVVVGNPPYVRIEQIAPVLQREYRKRFASIYDRADLYVAFIEHGLNLLGPDGVLSFVCADRWTLNKYGAPLRQVIADRFHVHCYIDLHDASPFESQVIAYPAIFSIGRNPADRVSVAVLASASPQECSDVVPAINDRRGSNGKLGVVATHYEAWFQGDEPWVLSTPQQLKVLRQLEEQHPALEACDAKVGIGVATGNDKVYIVGPDADIEPERLVPLVMRDDIQAGQIHESHRFVINTFQEGGGVVDLKDYPRLARYLDHHGSAVRTRHVAKSNPRAWFRTIDRVYPNLVAAPKLLIPDIAGANEIALDEGRFHPHHNLYFVTSASWDMRVLGALLSSKVALFFVWSYAVKMRGGYLRFQAQYLRRIRLPKPSGIPKRLAAELSKAFERRDFAKIDTLALTAYGLEALPEFEFVDTRS